MFRKLLKKQPLYLILFLGLFLRLSLLFLDYSWDVHNHIVWAKDLWQSGFAGFYEKQSSEVYATIYPNYPPLAIFIFYLFYPLQSIIEKIAWQINIALPLFPSKLIFFIQSRTFLAAVMKLPAVFADLGIAWLCFLIVLRLRSGQAKNKMVAILAVSFVLFNPAFFYNSSLWGQIDIIPIFFVLFSFYLLLFNKRYLLSGLVFTLALLVKPTAFVYFPLYIIFFIYKYSLINFFKTFLISNFIFLISFLPFLKNLNNFLLPYSIYSEKILAAQSLPYVTNGAFNFWVLIKGFTGIKDTAPFIFGIPYQIWGYLITGFFIILIIYRLLMSFLWKPRRTWRKQESRKLLDSNFRGNDSHQNIFYAVFLIAFAAFLFLTKMHERYSLLPLPFLLLLTLKKPGFLKWYFLLSIMSFLNHYHSWSVPKLAFITSILYSPTIVYALALINLILFLYLLSSYLRYEKPRL